MMSDYSVLSPKEGSMQTYSLCMLFLHKNIKWNLYQWRIPWHHISKSFYSRIWYTKMLQEYYTEHCPLSASYYGQSQK